MVMAVRVQQPLDPAAGTVLVLVLMLAVIVFAVLVTAVRVLVRLRRRHATKCANAAPPATAIDSSIPPGGILGGMVGYEADKEAVLRRLRRIEGQVRGLQQMVADDRYCIDVLTQISAATKALQSVAVGLLDGHLRHCVADAIGEGGPGAEAKIAEATAAVERLIKS